jgi:multiple sugar transport system ATP-binding protein
VPRLVLEDLTKTFPAPEGKPFAAVDGVTLTIADRELLALVGPSGSGKTTLLRLIAGLESPERGNISFDGHNVTWHSPQDRDVALVFQSHALFPHFTAFENIAFGLKLRGTPADQIHTRVHETAELLGVVHCLDRRPAKLSGGERQRIALGRALIREPKVLLLDEPFANLDEPLRLQLRTELPRLRQRFATTIIFVTHDQEEALALGDRVAVIRKGALQQVGTPREIYERPANRFVASFLGTPAMNLFHGTIAQREGHLVFLGAEPDDLAPATLPSRIRRRARGLVRHQCGPENPPRLPRRTCGVGRLADGPAPSQTAPRHGQVHGVRGRGHHRPGGSRGTARDLCASRRPMPLQSWANGGARV